MPDEDKPKVKGEVKVVSSLLPEITNQMNFLKGVCKFA